MKYSKYFPPPIKHHRVVVKYGDSDTSRWDEMADWLVKHVGREDMDTGEWHVTSFNDSLFGTNTHIVRFVDPRHAVLFKLTWGGAP